MALVTVADIRAEGLTETREPTATDDVLEAAADLATEYINTITRQRFLPTVFGADAPLLLDGTGTQLLHLPLPVIALTSVSEAGNSVALTDLTVYNRSFPDDRWNPKIAKKTATLGGRVDAILGGGGMFGPPTTTSTAIWYPGRLSVALVGTFGFCEPDGLSPPPLIKKTALRLVMRYWRTLADPQEPEDSSNARVMHETSDRHSYTLGGLIASAGLTGVPVIDLELARYTKRFVGSTRSLR